MSRQKLANRWFWVMVTLWVLTWFLGYFGFGPYQYEKIEGIDPQMMPRWPTLLFLGFGLLSGLVTLWWAFGLRTRPSKSELENTNKIQLYRRSFLLGGAALTSGAAGVVGSVGARLSDWLVLNRTVMYPPVVKTDPNPQNAWHDSKIIAYRELGLTGFKVSDISIGTTQFLRHPEPIKYLEQALDRGINYIDTSPDYAGASAELAIGDAISNRRRENLFIATKWCTSEGHVRQGSSVKEYIKAIEASLKRLQTDYVDLVHIHACDTVDRLLDPNVHEAFERLKEQGKVRFMGVSTHTPNLEEVISSAIRSDLFDVMMLAYHHGAWPMQQALIQQAASKGMGVVAMKTLKGAKHKGLADFRPESDAFSQAAFKWVLSNPAISCLVVSFFENQHLDEYLYASGKDLTNLDVATLEKYDHLIAGTHCFAHCGTCLDSCPASLPINDILRYRMYFENYGDQKQAMQLYSANSKSAESCIGCAAPCIGNCPSGINIKNRMIGAHEQLTFS